MRTEIHYLVFDGTSAVVQVVPARQQVQDWAIPLKSDVMALLSLSRQRCGDVKRMHCKKTPQQQQKRSPDQLRERSKKRQMQQQRRDTVTQHVCQC